MNKRYIVKLIPVLSVCLILLLGIWYLIKEAYIVVKW